MAHSMDLSKGSVFKKMVIFTTPILLTNLMQQLYHAADVIVVGNYAQDSTVSLAAVGATGPITNLLLNLFVGLSVGANVICSHLFGAGDKEKLEKAMYSSVLLGIVCGVLIGGIGFFSAKPLLRLIGTPESVLDPACTYMRIIFLGQPASLVYNFGAAILRSFGDTKRPMYILTATGFLNVILNLVFVAVCHWDAAGVALATIAANYVSAAVVLVILFHPKGDFCLRASKLRFFREQVKEIARIGIPAGVNGMTFSISNVIIVSSVNSLGDVYLAAQSAAGSLEGIVYQLQASVGSACVSFAGQNFGAKQFDRIIRLFWQSIAMVEVILISLNLVLMWNPSFFLGLFTTEADVIQAGIPRLFIVSCGYCIFALAEISMGCLRGMGVSFVPATVNVCCICIPRILWVLFIFPFCREYWFLVLCYPVSWMLAALAQVVAFVVSYKKKKKSYEESLLAAKREQPVLAEGV